MKKANLYSLIELLLIKAQYLGLVKSRDIIFLRNQLYFKFNLDMTYPEPCAQSHMTLAEIAYKIAEYLDRNVLHTLGTDLEIVAANIIGMLLPAPSIIEEQFYIMLKQNDIKSALNWFYEYNCHTNYIKSYKAKNISWNVETEFGKLDLTINLTKPEKDPHEIIWMKFFEAKHSKYPKCALCIENEGFSGDNEHPPRFTHRLIQIKLDDKVWFFQFSPYSYFKQHSIIVLPEHKEMLINQQTFKNFFSFVDQVPHYIIGSNSDIPIVGGSILTHDHYQAGDYIFPVEQANIKFRFELKKYSMVELSYLNWPLTTLRIVGDKNDLLSIANLITQTWYSYNDETLQIVSHTNTTRHNAVTPIMRKLKKGTYCIYLILRNNLTTAESPEGIFHPHKQLHHIKKENIGLIEAMGLAILPGRLAVEVEELKSLLLLNNRELAITELLFDQKMVKHESWLVELYAKYNTFNGASIDSILYTEIGLKFCQVLQDSGVFKHNPAGDRGMLKFLNHVFG